MVVKATDRFHHGSIEEFLSWTTESIHFCETWKKNPKFQNVQQRWSEPSPSNDADKLHTNTVGNT